MKICVATNNRGKFVEIKELLESVGLEAASIFDLNLKEPEETADTFVENAMIKAKFYAAHTNLPAISDDSGLCIEALSGKPGVHSARFAIDEKGEKNFPKTFEKIFSQLKEKGVDPYAKPAAHFICNLGFFDSEKNISINFEGRIDGLLTFPARGNSGFGYDPIFIKNGMEKTFGEISAHEKDKISHRAIAFEAFEKWLRASYNKVK